MERTVDFWDQFTFERPLNLYFVARGQKIRLSLSMCHVGLSVQRVISVIWSLSTFITTAQAHLIDGELIPIFPSTSYKALGGKFTPRKQDRKTVLTMDLICGVL